jgi:hypothetical protein
VALRWRHADASEWSVLVAAPGTNGGFVEANVYYFESPGAGWSLLVDDEPLASVADGAASTWKWEPGFFAGEVTAELMSPTGFRSALFLLDVSPNPSKAGREVFQAMVDELWDEDPSLLLGVEPATQPIGELGSFENEWLAFARLRRYAPELLRALDAVRARPRRALRSKRDSAALHQVRRIDRQSVAALVRSPAAQLFASDPLSESTAALHARLDVPVVEHTIDASANRAMLALILAVRRRCRSLIERLHQIVDTESSSETRTELAARWPVRKRVLSELDSSLSRAATAWPFSDVSRAEISAAGLTGIAADPSYARAWGRGWRALRHGLEGVSDVERLWISPTWEIYERWCFVRLARTLREAHPEWGWRRRSRAMHWTGGHGGAKAELQLQPTFSTSETELTGRWSVSKQRVPDILFTVTTGSTVRFVVLDAKYRITRHNVLDAMESAHIYQDSLRIGAARPEMTLLLVPSGGGASWLEAADFHAKHGVGVWVMSPERASIPETLFSQLLKGAAA